MTASRRTFRPLPFRAGSGDFLPTTKTESGDDGMKNGDGMGRRRRRRDRLQGAALRALFPFAGWTA